MTDKPNPPINPDPNDPSPLPHNPNPQPAAAAVEQPAEETADAVVPDATQDMPDVNNEIGQYYTGEDGVLPMITLPNPCPIRISITGGRVTLQVGPRDWGWDRGCPDTTDAGTMLSQPVPDENTEL